MKKALKKASLPEIYYYKDGKKVVINREDKTTYPSNLAGNIFGLYGDVSSYLNGNIYGIYGDISDIYGDVSGLSGDISNLSGNVSGLFGNVSGLFGDVFGIYGNVSNLTGFIDDCGLTDEDRKKGVNIEDLVG